MSTTVNNIRKGNVIKYNGDPCIVLENVIRTPPNLRSFCQMSLRNLSTGKVIHNRTNVGDSYEVLHKEVKTMEYSYENQGLYNFMDPETFESVDLDKEVVGDALDFLSPNKTYEIFYVDGKALGINLPASVEMLVTEAPDAIRGDTSGNVQKTVVLETGLNVRVPIFIKTGDVIKISTEDKSYLGRV